jgi:hypothetical protein
MEQLSTKENLVKRRAGLTWMRRSNWNEEGKEGNFLACFHV